MSTKIIRDKDGTVLVERFSPIRRVEHLLIITTFVLLILTGLPQKFHGDVSAWILKAFGGLDTARTIHRVSGVVFTFHAILHVAAFAAGMLTGKMRPTLVPTVQDLRDTRDNILYYLGFRDHAPALPKFDYRQKFEYIGLILGGLIMIFSGLVLMYPQLVASLLPGQLIPAAQMMHTNEAMLALLVLVVWHVYGSHLSPDVFPMDTSVFTGYMAAEDMRHHHAKEYARLFPGGDHEQAVPGGPSSSGGPSEPASSEAEARGRSSEQRPAREKVEA